MAITGYHAKYFARQLTRRIAANDPEKLSATLVDAQVDLNPHQVEAALFAFKSPLSNGAVLADEMNMSKKTIENYMAKLKSAHYIERIGSDKTGSWKTIKVEEREIKGD